MGDFEKCRFGRLCRNKADNKTGVKYCRIDDIFPRFVTESLKEALPEFDKKLKGFADPNALLTAPETRSSSPVRIMRDSQSLQSVSVKGLYPCGEGRRICRRNYVGCGRRDKVCRGIGKKLKKILI